MYSRQLGEKRADHCEQFVADWVEGVDEADRPEVIKDGIRDVLANHTRFVQNDVIRRFIRRGILPPVR